MTHRTWILGALAGLAGLTVVAVTAGTGKAAGPAVILTAELADLSLGTFYNSLMSTPADHITNDRGVRLGSLSSDLFHDPAESYNEFWAVSDRGPNGNPGLRTFLTPAFSPLIFHVRVHGTRVSVLEAIPIVDTANRPVTGLSNISGFDETPFDYLGTTALAFNPNGLDTEGLVRMRDGSFWLVDEYSPSLVHVSRRGMVADRFVPEDSQLAATLASTPGYRVRKTLPAVLTARRQNRGFEGIAVSPDESTLFLAMQSPLEYPTRALGRASRMVRILRFDVASERVTGEYVYEFDEVCTFIGQASGCGVAPGEMKISALYAVSGTVLLVQERTDTHTKVYRVDLARATNILGTRWDTRETAPTAATPAVERFATAAAAAAEGVTVLPKTLVVDVTALPGVPGKIEGIAMASSTVMVVGNDNDFGLVDNATFDTSGRLSNDTGVTSKLLFIELPVPVN